MSIWPNWIGGHGWISPECVTGIEYSCTE